MGYRGGNNFDERDKLFGASSAKPGINREVKKNLDALFAPKAQIQAQQEACKEGHAWIRDWDRAFKCSRCKTLKPDQSAKL